ncbi:MAG: hypothetical protein ACTSRG_10325 [Candidatus Helarchaeota archaeon]
MEFKTEGLKISSEEMRKFLEVFADSKFYTKPFADELGRSVAEFYKEMLQDNVPVEHAADFTRHYIGFLRYPIEIEKVKLELEAEYSKKMVEIYKSVNEKLWNLLDKLNLVHTVDAKPMLASRPSEQE